MHLSQAHLKLLSQCPRQFQLIYLEQLAPPLMPDRQEPMRLGSQFHLLMQQRELGLDIGPMVSAHPQLNAWLQTFLAAAPQILTLPGDEVLQRQSEQERTVARQDHVLVGVYDLLLLGAKSAQILDWKTYAKPRQVDALATDWQTRLYLYLLAATTDYRPEDLAMTYWFLQADGSGPTGGDRAAQRARFAYSTALDQQMHVELMALLTQFSGWLARYETGGEAFPQVPAALGRCVTCSFAGRCQRGSMPTGPLSLAEIGEVALDAVG
jgi:PD-(D/E)XK nuclease superfamily